MGSAHRSPTAGLVLLTTVLLTLACCPRGPQVSRAHGLLCFCLLVRLALSGAEPRKKNTRACVLCLRWHLASSRESSLINSAMEWQTQPLGPER